MINGMINIENSDVFDGFIKSLDSLCDRLDNLSTKLDNIKNGITYDPKGTIMAAYESAAAGVKSKISELKSSINQLSSFVNNSLREYDDVDKNVMLLLLDLVSYCTMETSALEKYSSNMIDNLSSTELTDEQKSMILFSLLNVSQGNNQELVKKMINESSYLNTEDKTYIEGQLYKGNMRSIMGYMIDKETVAAMEAKYNPEIGKLENDNLVYKNLIWDILGINIEDDIEKNILYTGFDLNDPKFDLDDGKLYSYKELKEL